MTASYQSNRRPDPFDRPLDVLIERLRWHELGYRWSEDDLRLWRAICPCCRDEMTLRESYVGGPVSIRCAGLGCDETRVVAALAAEPYRPEEGLDLAEGMSALAHRALELLESRCR
jgi:hypothetical protein